MRLLLKLIVTLLAFNMSYGQNASSMYFDDVDGTLIFKKGDQSFLGYQYGIKLPPLGVERAFKRSGFIHPLWTPNGEVLTRIQPEDHYHHYGIWNPWTHVEFKGDTLDFWNLVKREGTVQTAAILEKIYNNEMASLKVLHEHVVLKDGIEEVALNEIQTISVTPIDDQSYYLDFKFEYNCAQDVPFKILEYRYEGLGWRTTEVWDNQNSMVLSSTGKDRKGVDGSKERWAIVQGELGNQYGGVIMMSHPDNFNHPEPMRVWPYDMYDRGDMFASFSTTKDTDWELMPGKTYTLNYRFLVFSGAKEGDYAEKEWQKFAKN